MTTEDGSYLVGHGVQVVTPNSEHGFVLDEKLLQGILLRDDIKDLPVVVVSVAGPYRKGKSFLLNFFLRYLHKTCHENISDLDEWLGAPDNPLKGFSWRGGSDRHTTGIHLWSEPFKASLPSGQKVAVLLMDTQGTFDSTSTVKDNATVFALSTMLSSVLIYNISQNIEEDDLQHLQLFIEYGRVAKDKMDGKPFQRLQFLVRDWAVAYEYAYGAVGGQQLLNKLLQVREGQHEELKRVRQDIDRCFEEVTCFLMPHPGLKVSTNEHFNGKLSDVDPEFQKCLNQLVPMLLASENLVQKKIGGHTVKAKDLLSYFKSYVKVFNGDALPTPTTILQATAEANNKSALYEAIDLYENLMMEAAGASAPYMHRDRLYQEHKKARDKAVHQFYSKKKMGGEELATKFENRLGEIVEEKYVLIVEQNNAKSMYNILTTPAVFLLVLVLGYLLSVLGDLLGVRLLALLGMSIVVGVVGLLSVWGYSRWTGEMREVGMQLDHVARIIHDAFAKGTQHLKQA
ncbi:atlastin-like [Trichoplusia ni]|uniref:Atlastin-like n=1 Tax=Trichoplusia ni TaxID=7111 RepID=A0A7E5WSI4_TRINI|nr:atlastin-like [Trichoplusia ni]